MEQKLQKLKKILTDMESALIAYSGGVDSTFLLRVTHDVLGDKIIAVIAESPTYPSSEAKQAKELAGVIGVKYLSITTDELSDPNFTSNPQDRCYWCKKELFKKLIEIARGNNLKYVLDGSNRDDMSDYRPGANAARELGVRSPLQDAGLDKNEIRKLSKGMGLPTWDKPSFACLASRFPFGSTISEEKLNMIGEAEESIRSYGIKQVRVRHYGDTARIEVLKEEINKMLEEDLRNKITNRLRELGYRYVTIDLEGYRTGSMNP